MNEVDRQVAELQAQSKENKKAEYSVEVESEELREGQYLRAVLDATPAENAIEIDRSLLVDQRQLYAVQDTLLKLIDVEVVHLTDQKAVVKGVEEGTLLVRKPIAGAFADMLVKIVEE